MDAEIKAFHEEARAQPEYWAQRAMSAASTDLQRLMVKRKLTRAQLAERIGKSKAYISRIFNDDVNFTLSTLVALARTMNGHLELRIVPDEHRQAALEESCRTRVQAYGRPIPVPLTASATTVIRPSAWNPIVGSSNDNLYDIAG